MQSVELCGNLFAVDGRGEEGGFLARGELHHLYLLVVAYGLQEAHLVELVLQGSQFYGARHLVADGVCQVALVVIHIVLAQEVVDRGDIVAERHDIVEFSCG